MPSSPPKSRKPWFKVRGSLPSSRVTLLMGASFLLPLAVWSFFAYTPGLWPVSFELRIATDLRGQVANPAAPEEPHVFQTIYRPGRDVMEKEVFQAYQKMVRHKNEEIRAYLAGTSLLPSEIRLSARSNKKVLRRLHPIAVEMAWMTEEQDTADERFYALWRDLATGEKRLPNRFLSQENLEIVQANWEVLSAASPTYQSSLFPKEPLLHLVPSGKKAIGRPSYLPAPHEVFLAAQQLIEGTSAREDSSLFTRYQTSLAIVFGGFLIACLVGIPIGLLAGTFAFFSKLFEPFVDFFRYMPAPAFGTLLVFLLGSHEAPKMTLVFLGTVPQMILMVANTTRTLDASLLDAAQTLGAGRGSLIFRVVIPGILDRLYNDLRILLGWAWTWLVIAELLGVKSGLTEIIDTQGRRFNFDIVYAVILLIGFTGFFTDQILQALRCVFFPWVGEKQNWIGKAVARIRQWFLSKPATKGEKVVRKQAA
ncbi:MAG: ABC transporter permease [Verrucomicrobiota bacterium]